MKAQLSSRDQDIEMLKADNQAMNQSFQHSVQALLNHSAFPPQMVNPPLDLSNFAEKHGGNIAKLEDFLDSKKISKARMERLQEQLVKEFKRKHIIENGKRGNRDSHSRAED